MSALKQDLQDLILALLRRTPGYLVMMSIMVTMPQNKMMQRVVGHSASLTTLPPSSLFGWKSKEEYAIAQPQMQAEKQKQAIILEEFVEVEAKM